MSDVKAVAETRLLDAGAPIPQARSRPVPSLNARRLKLEAVLGAADALAAWACMAALVAALHLLEHPVEGSSLPALLAPAALLICLDKVFGVYETYRSSPVEIFRSRVLSASVFTTFVAAIFCAHLGLVWQVVAWLLLFPLLTVVGSVAGGIARLVAMKLGLWLAPIVLIGDAATTQAVVRVIAQAPSVGLRVVGRLSPDEARLARQGTPRAEVAELAILMSCGDWQEDALLAAELDFPSVVIARDVGDMQTLWLSTHTIGGIVGIEIRHSLLSRSRLLKRTLDVLIGLALLACSLPAVVCLAAAVWSVDRGNPFFAQSRIGFGGRIFRVWKIRSMFVDAEERLQAHLAQNPAARAEWARTFKLARDPRILPGVGEFIRRCSLDELPQFWNVVRGDMSLVGPRPFPAYHLAGFSKQFQALRNNVMPGLTGLWQITSRSDGDLVVQESADRYYVRNWSVWFDLYILLNTLPAVVLGKGAR